MADTKKPNWFPKEKNYESFIAATIVAAGKAVEDGKIKKEEEKND